MYSEMYFDCVAFTKNIECDYQSAAIHFNQLVHITAFYITKYIDISYNYLQTWNFIYFQPVHHGIVFGNLLLITQQLQGEKRRPICGWTMSHQTLGPVSMYQCTLKWNRFTLTTLRALRHWHYWRSVELTWSTLGYLSSNLKFNFLNCTITVPMRTCPQTSVLPQAPTANPQHVHLDNRHLLFSILASPQCVQPPELRQWQDSRCDLSSKQFLLFLFMRFC